MPRMNDNKTYFLPDDVYQALKWTGLIALPAIAAFIGVIAPVWGWPDGLSNALVVTFNAAGVLVGALIGVSQLKAKGGDEDA